MLIACDVCEADGKCYGSGTVRALSLFDEGVVFLQLKQ